eukprot:TRINITY_DN969_c0_g1_i2.p1 TRINITY_DN969_c0_g1~~TRINITY_DN969_c0_g1_i2.p1  ORF type:complete len:222 (+),score=38.90 TRINITY_DN969_c0_g1_i2:38-703(+)
MENGTQNCGNQSDATYIKDLKLAIQQIIQANGNTVKIVIVLDFDDTFAYKKGFNNLMHQGKYEEAYAISLTMAEGLLELLQLSKKKRYPVIILSSAHKPIAELVNAFGERVSDAIGTVLRTRNIELTDGRIKTIPKGQILREYLEGNTNETQFNGQIHPLEEHLDTPYHEGFSLTDHYGENVNLNTLHVLFADDIVDNINSVADHMDGLVAECLTFHSKLL